MKGPMITLPLESSCRQTFLSIEDAPSSPYVDCCLDCVVMRDALAASTVRVVSLKAALACWAASLASFVLSMASCLQAVPITLCKCNPVGSIATHEIQSAALCQVHTQRAQGMRSTIRLSL